MYLALTGDEAIKVMPATIAHRAICAIALSAANTVHPLLSVGKVLKYHPNNKISLTQKGTNAKRFC